MADVAEMALDRIEERTPHALLEETRAVMEDLAAKMLLVKQEGRPKSELRELVTQMSLNFITLRQVNRSILVEEDKIKEETEIAKAPVDFTTLQLHNLTYEKNHYLKAIKACKDFRSKYPKIDLVSEEEFFRDAPDDIKAGVLSNDGAQDLMLKRLNYELLQRKELCKLHETLEQRKMELVETISSRKKFLSSLPSHLKSLKKASLPVQQQLGILHTKKSKQNSSAELLPPPLYIIFSQLLSQKEAFGESIELEILGSIKDAQSFSLNQASKDPGTGSQLEVLRLDEDFPDDDDEGQRRRKRPKKALPKDNTDTSGIYQAHPLGMILHVFDDEPSGPKPLKLISLKFEFLVKLNVVCVGVEGPDQGQESILCNLFPDDIGIELPHQTAKIYAGENISFEERNLRPYKWAQHLGGMDILPEAPPVLETAKKGSFPSGLSLYRHQHRVTTFLQRIRSRKKSQMALEKQLESLSRLTFPSLSFNDAPWTLYSPSCALEQWSALKSTPDTIDDPEEKSTREEGESAREDGELPSAAQIPTIVEGPKSASPEDQSRSLTLMSKKSTLSVLGKSTSFRRNDDMLDMILDSDSDTEPVTNASVDLENEDLGFKGCRTPWEEYDMREFVMVLSRCRDRERKTNLVAKIGISAEYPLRPPYFSLSLAVDPLTERSSEWFNELRIMEAEVNVQVPKMLPSEWDEEVLSHQIRCLAVLFDLSVDQMQRKTLPSGQPLGSMPARSSRGRDRRKLPHFQAAPSGAHT